MSDNNTSGIKKFTASFAEKFGIDKKKILTSLLLGFAAPFVLIICTVFIAYFNDADELPFMISDFAPAFILISLGVFAVITVALLLTKGVFRNSIFVILSSVVICGYIQYMVTTLTFKGLPGDGNADPAPEWVMILNFAVWVILLAAAVWFGILSAKSELGRTVISFLLILVTVMQVATFVPEIINYTTADSEDMPSANVTSTKEYLTTAGMFELSTKDNVVVFLVDRFDSYYFDEINNHDSTFFDDFDGFTYYKDNISMYPRTYPATTSILTGTVNEYTYTREEYFEKAYGESTFLSDLAKNNYKINLYIPSYYAYENASVFNGMVANVSSADGYIIPSKGKLVGKMFELSSYFWAPELLKSQSISSKSFSELSVLNGEAPKYEMNDPAVYDEFEKTGIYTQNSKNTFTMIHLRGCHYPYNVDENCNEAPENTVTSIQQTTGVFKLIREYIDQMKKLGIYDDATIIITGDHAMLTSDREDLDNPFITALMVKRSGDKGTKMVTSSAPVAQENMFAEIVKSAGIRTNADYGKAYSDIPEGATTTRTMYLQEYKGGKADENVTYEITGSGLDFNNWKIVDRENIGYIYK